MDTEELILTNSIRKSSQNRNSLNYLNQTKVIICEASDPSFL